ncbi:MAG: glycosyltransferase family 4 protein [Balneola sp.]|nr:glycosyltransferase family 4 protein [Balneola sp.]MBO6651164.1 glycosyltransferase family 4 protein [Balneola sp.]MBO6710353.1 glycosyltransferase family 4 protein [Balneola sp.]MBO6799038.1 glycosyltransferase family 4 protein [Balneola sp.]MBO6870152.1 glycosyltransferase family 4 protein [Balneola sp.]
MFENQRLLIIGTVWPEPESSAAGSRMMQLIEFFQENEYEITFACSASNLEFSEDLNKLGIKTESIKINDSGFDRLIEDLKPDVVLFDRFMTEEQFGWRVSEYCPDALKILDTEDLHCLRYARHKALKNGNEFKLEDLYSDEARREIAAIYRCDISLIISKFEYELLTDFFNIDTEILHYLPFMFEELDSDHLSDIPKFEERQHFISIGNFLHEPNWDAVRFLKEDIWKLIRKELPEAELHIYGAYTSLKVEQLHNKSEGFLIKGRANSAEEVLKHARVLLAPLRFGAGLKGKFTDAMKFGTPSVTTKIGAEGMKPSKGWGGVLGETPDEITQKAIQLYSDKSVWVEAQKTGVQIFNQLFNKAKHGESFGVKIASVTENLQDHRKKNFIGSMFLQNTLQSYKYMSKWIEEKNKNL